MGQLAPFFLKRVFFVELHGRISVSPIKRWIRILASPARQVLAKLFGDSAFVEMQTCGTCSFVQAKHPFSEEAITRLYLDYRSDSYNSERIKYEPTYRTIADRVGVDDVEIRARVKAAGQWLAGKIETSDEFTMLDYGGADGRFLPQLPGEKFVYEVSNVSPLHEHINKYSLSAIAHLLRKAGLEFVDSRADSVDVGWAEAVHLRALGRKVS